MDRPKAIVYIDGFNLYYRAVRPSGGRWLNIQALFDELLKDYEVEKIYYFSANIKAKARPADPDAPNRQKSYLNALKSLSRVEVIQGNFAVTRGRSRLRLPERILNIRVPKKLRDDTWIPVWKVEEKGSDVSLGAHLIRDAALKRADLLVCVTSDSDLAPTLQIATGELQAEVALCLPAGTSSRRMQACGPKFMIWLSKGAITRNALPNPVHVNGKTYYKPDTW